MKTMEEVVIENRKAFEYERKLRQDARKIAQNYTELYPAEGEQEFGPFYNWLVRMRKNPSNALATCNWAGKVTRAYFASVGMNCPRTKREMLREIGKCEHGNSLSLCPSCSDLA